MAQFQAMQEEGNLPFRIVLHYGSVVLGSVSTMQELHLHGPEVNFTFRTEKIAGNNKLPIMHSEAASSIIGMEMQLAVTSKVDSFSGGHRFYVPMR